VKTRISPQAWDPVPVPPDQAAALIPGIPLLVVHGDQDPYFPVEHAQQIFRSAHDPKELWLLPGYGHAESACPPELADRIGAWVAESALAPVAEALARAAGAGVAEPPAAPIGTQPPESAIEKAETAVEAAGATGRPGPGHPDAHPNGDAGSSGYQPEGSGMPSL
jgi:hypothetical protein